MRIFLTGATGFVGQAFCRLALARGHRLLALRRNGGAPLPPDIEIAGGTLADTPWAQVEKFSPDAALHLAWVATPAVYLESPENEVWLEQSKPWFRQLRTMGVPRLAGAGTCIEYAASAAPLREAASPLGSVFPYSRAKAALFQWLRDEAADPADWSWFRIFYPYGPGEHPNRVGSSLIRQLSAGQPLSLRTPRSVKDYIFIDDVAAAICHALEVRLTGAVNVGTGEGIAIGDLALLIASLVGADPALVQSTEEPNFDPNPVVIADTQLLRDSGWSPSVGLNSGLQRLINSLSMSSL